MGEISRLGDIGVWRDACVQILFSLSPGMGTAITMSSFTKPKENVYAVCWIVAVSNSMFSFVGNITYKINLQTMAIWKAKIGDALDKLTTSAAVTQAKSEVAKVDLTVVTNYALNASAAVFLRNAVNGVLAANSEAQLLTATNVNFTSTLQELELATVADLARSGTGLAFVTLADAMGTFGGAKNIMAVILFVTLLTLGLDSTFAWVETLVSYVDDAQRAFNANRPAEKKMVVPKIASTGFVSVILFLFGLPFCARMGLELLDTVDNYVGLMFLLFSVFIEGILFPVHFGFDRFEMALKTACGVTMGPVQRAYWRFTTHGTMIVIPLCLFIWDFVNACMKPYGDYPAGMQAVGFVLLFICLLLVLIGAVTAGKMGGSTLDDMPGAKLIEDPQKPSEKAEIVGKAADVAADQI